MAVVTGTSGNNTLIGTASDDFIYGLAGDDLLSAGNGNDYLEGGIGIDTLNGGTGDDIYFFSTGDGADIANETLSGGGSDIIEFGTGIISSALTFIRQGNNNLIITYGTGDQITVQNQFQGNTPYIFETVKFSNGSTIDLTTKQFETFGTSGGETLIGITTGGSIDDILHGLGGSDTLSAGNGNDYLDGGTGDDTLNGVAGNDTYFFDTGYGLDIAQETASGSGSGSGIDIVKFGTGIVFSDLSFVRQNNNDLIITLNANDIITLKNHFAPSDAYRFETLEFSDTTTVDLEDIQFTNYGTNGNDSLYGVFGGGLKDDIIYGLDGNDQIIGLDGNDIIYGGNGLDNLWGDPGGGDNGSDTFVFEAASAFNNIDTIGDFSMTDNDKIDISDLLIGFNSGSSNINDYVTLSVASGDTTIAVDRDGAGGAYSSQSVTLLDNSSGFTVNDLYNNGHIIV